MKKGNKLYLISALTVLFFFSNSFFIVSAIEDNSIALISASQVNLTGQAGWNYYNGGDSPSGAYMGWMYSGTPSLNGNIKLPKVLTPGRYYVFVKGIAYSQGLKMNLSLGGSVATLNLTDGDFNKYWSSAGTLDISSNSNNLNVRLIKAGPIGGTEKFLFMNVYITDISSEIVFKNDAVVNLIYPTVMDNSAPVKGNVIENSGFEVGTSHGWGLGSQKGVSVSSLWDNKTSKYGFASLALPLSGESSTGDNRTSGTKLMVSRIYTLTPNKKYTLSAWVKTDLSGVNIPAALTLANSFGIDSVFSPPPGYPPQHKISTSFTVTNTWQRITLTGYALAYPTSDYHVILSINPSGSLNGKVLIDGIQLEEGDLTNYVPMREVEIGIRTKPVSNIYFDDEEIKGDLLAYNFANIGVSKTIDYEIYDYLNRIVKRGSLNINIPANSTKYNSINLDSGKKGIFRIVYWIRGEEGSEDELVYSVVPHPKVMGIDENSVMGIHPNYYDWQLEALQRLGIKWARVMSPSAFFRWNVVEPIDDQFIWYDDQVKKASTYGITTLGTLGTNKYWPAWANDSSGQMNLTEWGEFVGQSVNHYKPFVKYWEIWNEPIYEFTPEFYAKMLKTASDAIEVNDPNAKIIGMGGIYDSTYVANVIMEMERQYPGWNWEDHIDYLATHLYPIEQKFDSVNRYDVFYSNFTKVYNLSIWNTEAGSWDLGFAKGVNSNFISFGKNLWGASDAQRYYTGSLSSPEIIVANFLHSVGNRETKYFYYDSRVAAQSSYYQTHPTIMEYDDSIRTKGIAYAIAGDFVYNSSSLGAVNLGTNVFAYLFNKNGKPMLAIWTKDQSLKTLKLSTSINNLEVYDMMGNPISFDSNGISFGRTPIYIIGKGISISEFQNILISASVTSRVDSSPPSISISSAPRGSINKNYLRIRWIAIDDSSVAGADLIDLSIPGSEASNVPSNKTSLLYSYRLTGYNNSWSAWKQNTFVDYSSLSNGKYNFEVIAIDAEGNRANVTREICIGVVCTNESQSNIHPADIDKSLSISSGEVKNYVNLYLFNVGPTLSEVLYSISLGQKGGNYNYTGNTSISCITYPWNCWKSL